MTAEREKEKQLIAPCEEEKQRLAKCEEEKQKAEEQISALTEKDSELTAEIKRLKAKLVTLKSEGPAKPRHFGMVGLAMVGVVAVLGVIIAAMFEARRVDRAG